MLETALNLAGLLLTAVGAFVAARNIIITRAQAESLSGTYVVANVDLYNALLAQSRGARNGLMCVVFGTGLQVVALALPVFLPDEAHTYWTATMASGSCKMEASKIASPGPEFLNDCMASKGFLYDDKVPGCAEAKAIRIYPPGCFRPEERSGLIERVRRVFQK